MIMVVELVHWSRDEDNKETPFYLWIKVNDLVSYTEAPDVQDLEDYKISL